MLKTIATVAGVLFIMVAVPAAAGTQTNSCTTTVDHGRCSVVVSVSGQPGGTGPVGKGTPAPASAAAAPDQQRVPACIEHALPDPPGAGDPLWRGNDPSAGRLVVQVCGPGPGPRSDLSIVFVPHGQAPPPLAARVSPAELAQRAVSQMMLLKPVIRMAPLPDSAGAVVGVPVWLWVERGESTTGPVTRSASAGGITVTATAKVGRVDWNMGDGRSVTCTSPGTPYDPSRAQQGSPDCGHVYQLRSLPERTGGAGKYTITATSVWQIHWEGGGQEGDQTLSLSSNAALAVGELQSVNRAGGN